MRTIPNLTSLLFMIVTLALPTGAIAQDAASDSDSTAATEKKRPRPVAMAPT